MKDPEDTNKNLDDITTRLRDERERLAAPELDGLRQRVMARAGRGGSRLLRWTGSTRLAAIGAGLVIAAGATGGTIATIGSSTPAGFDSKVPQNAACDQYMTHMLFRFHYSAHGSPGFFSNFFGWSPISGIRGCSGTVSIGPYAMEGDLQLNPNDTVKLGYQFAIPGTFSSLTVTFDSASWKLYWSCPRGGNPNPASTTVTQTDPPTNASYTVRDWWWHPDADDYQDSTTVPAACGVNKPVSLRQGVLFTAQVTAS